LACRILQIFEGFFKEKFFSLLKIFNGGTDARPCILFVGRMGIRVLLLGGRVSVDVVIGQMCIDHPQFNISIYPPRADFTLDGSSNESTIYRIVNQ